MASDLEALIESRILPPIEERRALRIAAGLTLKIWADALGVSVSALQAWERGTTYPRGRRLAEYSQGLRDLRRLVAGEPL